MSYRLPLATLMTARLSEKVASGVCTKDASPMALWWLSSGLTGMAFRFVHALDSEATCLSPLNSVPAYAARMRCSWYACQDRKSYRDAPRTVCT